MAWINKGLFLAHGTDPSRVSRALCSTVSSVWDPGWRSLRHLEHHDGKEREREVNHALTFKEPRSEVTHSTSLHISLAKDVLGHASFRMTGEVQSYHTPRRKTRQSVTNLHIYPSEVPGFRIWKWSLLVATLWVALKVKLLRREFMSSQIPKSNSRSVSLQAKLNPRVQSL